MKPMRVRTISQFHQLYDLYKPDHPLISVIDFKQIGSPIEPKWNSRAQDFYSISIKRTSNAIMKYGQQEYDFDSGVLFFMAPGQIFNVIADNDSAPKHTGWLLLIHPDFLWNTNLAKAIHQYEFFNYSINEALFLSEKEECTIDQIIKNIQQEYHSNIDAFSQNIIISQIETLLNYAERFYQRQFVTRKITNHKVLEQLEAVLTEYFDNDQLLTTKGLPTVQYISEILNISPSYLSGLLTSLTGQSTQQHIHNKLINKAKERLSITDLSVSEIAYELGFEHPQSFSKLFKKKTKTTPSAFRNSFN